MRNLSPAWKGLLASLILCQAMIVAAAQAARPEGSEKPGGESPASKATKEKDASHPSGPSERTAEEEGAGAAEGDESRLSDQPIPLAKLPARPKPLIELGSPFLGTGRINEGFRLPGGAVWQPSFLLFGTFRTGLSGFDAGRGGASQWANRLDLFGNLYLSGTERLVFGIRPLDETTSQGGRRFTGGAWGALEPNGGVNGFNFDWDTVTHLFFEGDFGEIFPNLDPSDEHALDLGFSVGRQPLSFQEGLLVNDFIDGVGITRNNLRPKGTSNLRITGFFGWNQINRNTPSNEPLIRNLEASKARMFGLFTETDWRFSTVAVDVIYIRGGTFRGIPDVKAGDGIYAGLSFVQRLGLLNSSFRLLGSIPVGAETPQGNGRGISDPASGGLLFLSELSWTPHHSHDLVYLNAFAAFDDYRAAALDPTVPGPLARAGVLFAGTGLGNSPSALSSTAGEVVGGAVGYQKFFAHTRRQLLLEAGGRVSTQGCAGPAASCGAHSLAGEARYQIAFGRRTVLVFDSYAAWDDLRGAAAAEEGKDSQFRYGARVELLLKF